MVIDITLPYLPVVLPRTRHQELKNAHQELQIKAHNLSRPVLPEIAVVNRDIDFAAWNPPPQRVNLLLARVLQIGQPYAEDRTDLPILDVIRRYKQSERFAVLQKPTAFSFRFFALTLFECFVHVISPSGFAYLGSAATTSGRDTQVSLG